MDNRLGLDRLLQSLREYFAASPYENEILLVLLFPSILILLWLWSSKGSPKTASQFTQKELEFFRMAALQKGLEEYDRNLLLELAEAYQIRPVYRLVIERDAFLSLKERFRKDHPENPESGKVKPSVAYLAQIQKKLFPESE